MSDEIVFRSSRINDGNETVEGQCANRVSAAETRGFVGSEAQKAIISTKLVKTP